MTAAKKIEPSALVKAVRRETAIVITFAAGWWLAQAVMLSIKLLAR